MNNTTELFNEKLKEILFKHYSLYHAVAISAMIFDENVKLSNFKKKLKLISKCEEDGIDEYDTIDNYYVIVDSRNKPICDDGEIMLFSDKQEALNELENNESVISYSDYLKSKGMI